MQVLYLIKKSIGRGESERSGEEDFESDFEFIYMDLEFFCSLIPLRRCNC